MLVLTRPEGAQVVVTHQGVELVITVVSARRGSARLGIDAPHEFEVFRKELHDENAARKSDQEVAK